MTFLGGFRDTSPNLDEFSVTSVTSPNLVEFPVAFVASVAVSATLVIFPVS
jgi:hypothetical protein